MRIYNDLNNQAKILLRDIKQLQQERYAVSLSITVDLKVPVLFSTI